MEILGFKIEKVNTRPKFVNAIEDALQSGGIEAAKEVCRNTRGKSAATTYHVIELFEKYYEK